MFFKDKSSFLTSLPFCKYFTFIIENHLISGCFTEFYNPKLIHYNKDSGNVKAKEREGITERNVPLTVLWSASKFYRTFNQENTIIKHSVIYHMREKAYLLQLLRYTSSMAFVLNPIKELKLYCVSIHLPNVFILSST